MIMLIITMILVRISRMKLMLVMRIVIMLIIMPQFLTTGGADHDDHISIRKMLMIIISMVIMMIMMFMITVMMMAMMMTMITVLMVTISDRDWPCSNINMHRTWAQS